jgi:hypothetical protein
MKSRSIGTGIHIKLAELAWLIGNVIGFEGHFASYPANPTAPHASCSALQFAAPGWRSKIDFRADIAPHRTALTGDKGGRSSLGRASQNKREI